MSVILDTLSIKTSHYILGGLALVTALSWNETIKKVISKYIPTPGDQLYGSILYSFIITLILIFMIYLLPDTENELPAPVKKKIRNIKLNN